MDALSIYAGNLLLQFLNGDAPSPPAGLYLALFDGDPKTPGTEVTTSQRVAGRLAISMATPVDNLWENSGAVDFGAAASGSWSLSHVAVFDAASSGNMLASRQIDGAPFAMQTGSIVYFAPGEIFFNLGT